MPPIFSKETTKIYVINDSHIGQHRTSPCEMNCLVGNPIQKMLAAVAAKDPIRGLSAIRAVNPFPGITGRVCPHPCEMHCNRGRHDEALSIRSLERYTADHGQNGVPRLHPLPWSGKEVGIIGGGPAGLACAYFLALLGHRVTVFEASPVAGGVLRQSIPDFRLPKDVVDREVGMVLDLGVRVLVNTEVGRDIRMEDIRDRFDACVVAVGNRRERRLSIPGIEKTLSAVSFLRRSNLERSRLEGQKVVILGGGGVAFDCAFTARRLGAAEVSLICLENRSQMKVPQAEIEQADEEGVTLHTGHLSAEICSDGDRVTGVLADAVEEFSFDERGRLHVTKIPGKNLEVGADIVICASGLMPDLDFMDSMQVDRTPRGCLQVRHGCCSLPGMFAAGECASGPSLVSAVIKDSRRTAFEVHAWLCGREPGQPLDAWINDQGRIEVCWDVSTPAQHEVEFEEIVNLVPHGHVPRHNSHCLVARETWLAFEELDKGLDSEAAQAEAARCMHCGHCQTCGECVDSCPGLILELGEHAPRVAWPDECWHCGCCRLACPGGCISFKFPIHTFL